MRKTKKSLVLIQPINTLKAVYGHGVEPAPPQNEATLSNIDTALQLGPR